jgi:FkbM family methyltransferase
MSLTEASPRVAAGKSKYTLARVADRLNREFKRVMKYRRAFGILEGVRWGLIRSANDIGLVRKPAVVHPPFLKHGITVRMHKSSDPVVFDQIFVKKEFEFLPLLSEPIKTVLDLGANIGCASAKFLNALPEAFVLAVEPDPANYKSCQKNLAPYGDRVRVLEGAVWAMTGRLVLSRGSFLDGREWATQVKEPTAGDIADVRAWDVPSLIELCQTGTIDLLKIDIEGSEKALFASHTDSWLPQVRNLCVELHGDACRDSVMGALRNYSFEEREFGEYTLYMNLKPIPAHDA